MPWTPEPSQFYNHIQGEHFLSQKDRFLLVLRRYARQVGVPLDFYPPSYLMNREAECKAYAAEVEDDERSATRASGAAQRALHDFASGGDSSAAHFAVDEARWLLKPAGFAGHNADGIRIFNHEQVYLKKRNWHAKLLYFFSRKGF